MQKNSIQPRWYTILFLCISVGVILNNAIIPYLREPNTFGRGDFAVFVAAARTAIHDKNPYSADLGPQLNAIRPYSGGSRFLYPPASLLFFAPLLALSFPVMAKLWFVCNIALVFVLMWLTERLMGWKRSPLNWCIMAATALAFSPLFTNFRTGQINLLLGVLLVLHLLLAKQKKTAWAAGVLSIAIVLKVFPLVLCGYYVVRKQWKMVGLTVVCSLALMLASFAVFGKDINTAYITKLSKLSTTGIAKNKDIARRDNPTINAMLYKVAYQHAPFTHVSKQTAKWFNTHLKILHMVIVLPLFGVLCFLTWRAKEIDPLLTPFAWISFVFMASKDIHSQYFVMLLPVFFAFFVWPARYCAKQYQCVLASIAYLCIAISSVRLYSVLKWEFFKVTPLLFIGNALIFTLLMIFLYSRQRSHDSTPAKTT